MKKSMLALAALTAFAGAASAQSSVTIGGIIDLAARSVKNGSAGTINSLSSAGTATPRLYFRGTEDLGGGLRAGFWLETELGPDTGSGGSTVAGTSTFWARRSTVSLMGGFGEVRLGRDWTVNYQSWNVVEIFGYVGVASPANVRGQFFGNAGPQSPAVRFSNTVNYFLPSMGGLVGQVQVAAGEGSSSANKSVGLRLGYGAGPLTLTGSWQKIDRHLAMTDDVTSWNVGGRYNLGFATLGAIYEVSDYSTATRRKLEQKIAHVNITVPVGSGRFLAQYTKTGGPGNVATPDQYKSTMFGVGYIYNLSRRTSLYANYGRIDNGGTSVTGANFTASGSGPAGIRRGENSTGYDFGIRHDF